MYLCVLGMPDDWIFGGYAYMVPDDPSELSDACDGVKQEHLEDQTGQNMCQSGEI